MNMKDFIKWVLAVLLGLFVWGIIKVFLFFMVFGSMAASFQTMSAQQAPVLPKEGVLLMDMSKFQLTDSESESFSLPLQSQEVPNVSLRKAIKALNIASEDPGIKYLLMRVDGISSSIANIEELRKALTDFRSGGKAVMAYGVNFTSGSYYLASVADKIYTTSHHGGNVFMLGVSSQMIFLKDLLDKLGINVQLIRHGKYKSAGEMYVKNAPSPENEYQNQEMISSIWETIGTETAEARGISLDSLNSFIDNLSLVTPEDMVEHNLVDGTLSIEDYKDKIADLAEKDSYKDVSLIPFEDYAAAKVTDNSSAKRKIAIVYAQGNIVEGNDPNNISGDRFASILAKVRADSTIKAVVFRVNSPGGTVLSADKIKEEVDALRDDKPVIASYGSYAASGGYWISNSCDRIFSDATTLTGSIGVFAALPDLSKALKDIAHVNVVSVKSHEHSDALSFTRPLDEAEQAYMQRSIEDIYELFVNTVAEGRGMEPAAVDSIAQGRIWTGADAIEIGLVDEIGGLYDALEYAASAAGDDDLDSWSIVTYPSPKSKIEQIMDQLGLGQDSGEEAAIAMFKGTMFENEARNIWHWGRSWMKGSAEQPIMFARLPYVMEIR